MDKILNKLASVQGRRDEIPNQELANELVESADKEAIGQIVHHLTKNKDKKIQQDCIKVLYEIGEKAPELITDYVETFVDLLASKNNRLVWGSMTAIDTVTLTNPEIVIQFLPRIKIGILKGSVITKDHGIFVLAKLSSLSDYQDVVFPLLIEELWNCPPKQLPMYAERSMIAIDAGNKGILMNLLNDRFDDLEKESQRKRVEKLLRKIRKV